VDENPLGRGLHQALLPELPERAGDHLPHRANGIGQLLLADRDDEGGALPRYPVVARTFLSDASDHLQNLTSTEGAWGPASPLETVTGWHELSRGETMSESHTYRGQIRNIAPPRPEGCEECLEVGNT
jgi:hypothetical protein